MERQDDPARKKITERKETGKVRTNIRCAWCGSTKATAWKEGIPFCRRCFPVMKVSKLSLGKYLIAQEKQNTEDKTEETSP